MALKQYGRSLLKGSPYVDKLHAYLSWRRPAKNFFTTAFAFSVPGRKFSTLKFKAAAMQRSSISVTHRICVSILVMTFSLTSHPSVPQRAASMAWVSPFSRRSVLIREPTMFCRADIFQILEVDGIGSSPTIASDFGRLLNVGQVP